MVDFSPGGMYIEAGVLLYEGEIIEIGIENSPYILIEDAIDCHKVVVIRRTKLGSDPNPYGYGLQISPGGQSHRPHINVQPYRRGQALV